MKTKTNTLIYSRTVKTPNGEIRIKCSLDDQCRNGHEDFSLTADIYERNQYGKLVDVGGGCCHDEILAAAPEFAPFAALHLSDMEGAPMHAAVNALYWFQGAAPESVDYSSKLGPCHGGTGAGAKTPEECRRIFLEHIRGTDEDFENIRAAAPRTEAEMSFTLEKLGFRTRWKREAKEAIRQLEKWTGAKFETAHTRKQWPKLGQSEAKAIEQLRASGYYEPEAIAARDAAKKEAARLAKIASVEKDFADGCDKLRKKRDVALYFAKRGIDDSNVIFYDHTNEIAFNWSSCSRLWTRDEFDAFTAEAKMSELPEDVKFRFQDRPKY